MQYHIRTGMDRINLSKKTAPLKSEAGSALKGGSSWGEELGLGSSQLLREPSLALSKARQRPCLTIILNGSLKSLFLSAAEIWRLTALVVHPMQRRSGKSQQDSGMVVARREAVLLTAFLPLGSQLPCDAGGGRQCPCRRWCGEWSCQPSRAEGLPALGCQLALTFARPREKEGHFSAPPPEGQLVANAAIMLGVHLVCCVLTSLE